MSLLASKHNLGNYKYFANAKKYMCLHAQTPSSEYSIVFMCVSMVGIKNKCEKIGTGVKLAK